jgi:hypothetical protein
MSSFCSKKSRRRLPRNSVYKSLTAFVNWENSAKTRISKRKSATSFGELWLVAKNIKRNWLRSALRNSLKWLCTGPSPIKNLFLSVFAMLSTSTISPQSPYSAFSQRSLLMKIPVLSQLPPAKTLMATLHLV